MEKVNEHEEKTKLIKENSSLYEQDLNFYKT